MAAGEGISGRAWEGGRARMLPAWLRIDGRDVVVAGADGAAIARAPRERVRFEGGMGRLARRATLPDGAVFETDDADGFDAVAGTAGGGLLHRAERFHPRLVLIALGCLGGAFLVWRFALTALVAVAVWVTPATLKRAIDAGTLETFDLMLAEPTSLPEEARAASQTVFDDLLAALPERDRTDYRLLFRSTPRLGPNAFALPGGTVVLTDEFVEAFPDPDLQATVLGHEIGHVVDQHGLRRLYRSVGAFVLISLIAGETGPVLEDVLLEGNVLLSLAYSRAHEREADAFGLRLAEAAGYDPAAMLEFFAYLIREAPGGGATWLSSHPANESRVDAIEAFVNER